MTMALQTEVQAMQNPALGAALLWRFACGYCPSTTSTAGAPLPLAFLVLPVMLHAQTREAITSTQQRSGIRQFQANLDQRVDLLLGVQRRAVSMRSTSLRSLRIAMASALVTLMPEKAQVWPRSYANGPTVAPRVRELMKASEKFGAWCKDLTLFEVAGILRVEF
jgi:hypothetical protein